MRPSVFAAACCALVTSGVVAAQPSRDAAARRRELLERASESSLRGDHEGALRLGEEAARIQVTPSLQMFLAEEHEFLIDGGGAHLLDAVRVAATCVRDATAQTALNNRERILQRCVEVVGRLNPRVAHVHLRVDDPVPEGMSVRVDEHDLPRGLWAEPIAVLPGAVVVDASAPGRGPFHRALRLPAGATEVVPVALPAGATATPHPEPAVPTREPPREAPSSSPLPIVGWSLLGLGVAAGAVGVWQWTVTMGLADDSANRHRPVRARLGAVRQSISSRGGTLLSVDDVCARAAVDAATDPDAAGANLMCEATSQAKALAWGFGLGAVALAAAGATLVLVGGHREAPRVTTSAILAPGVGGVSMRVTF